MSKLTIMGAVKVVPVSESKLRRDLKSGKVSFITDKNGKKVIDTSELQRVYGLIPPDDTPKNGNDGHESHQVITLLEHQITDLRNQLERAEMREDALIAERVKLLSFADRMLPAPKRSMREWVQTIFGVRQT